MQGNGQERSWEESRYVWGNGRDYGWIMAGGEWRAGVWAYMWGTDGGVECPEIPQNGRVCHDNTPAYTNIAANPVNALESVCTFGYKHKLKKPGITGPGLTRISRRYAPPPP